MFSVACPVCNSITDLMYSNDSGIGYVCRKCKPEFRWSQQEQHKIEFEKFKNNPKNSFLFTNNNE